MKYLKNVWAILIAVMLVAIPCIGVANAGSWKDFLIAKETADSVKITQILSTVIYMSNSQIPDLDLDHEVIKEKEDSTNTSIHSKLDLILENQAEISASFGKEVFIDAFVGADSTTELMPWWTTYKAIPALTPDPDVKMGYVELITSANYNDMICIDMNDEGIWTKEQEPELNAVVEVITLDNSTVHFGFNILSSGNHALFYYNSDVSPNWTALVRSGMGSSKETGIAVDTNIHLFSIKLYSDKALFYIDEVEVANLTAYLPDGSFDVGICTFNNQNTITEVHVDYIEVISDRW